MKKILALTILILTNSLSHAQKVGLVLSGGGSKGLAHIGVLKALEENHIPIDYIVGTSMGGVVGGMYAAGYTPQQMEKIATSPDFQDWISGRYYSDFSTYFKKKEDNPSSISLKLEIDTGFQAHFRSTIINDIPLNFALIELVVQASANSRNDFNHLFVPLRIVVADVFSQKTIDIDTGSLAEALRGTVSVPMIYRPVKVGGRYVFDGGLYNNFPVDIMKKDFNPDYIIGTNVSSKTFNDYPKENDEKLMGRLLIYMFLSKSDSTSIGKNGIYIQPNLASYSSTNFVPVKEMIKAGYDATMADMDRIKAGIKRRTDSATLNNKRNDFLKENKPVTFNKIIVTGANYQQARYIERVFHKDDNAPISLSDIRQAYYRLVTNDNFETIYPRIIYHPANNTYDFEVDVKSIKNFRADIGGVVSSRPISTAYLGLQYDYINRNAFTAGINLYTGRFYESAQATLRSDFPTRLPFYLEGNFTYNYWNYFNDNKIFVEKTNPLYVAQSDKQFSLRAGIPVVNHGKLELEAGYLNTGDQYSPNNTFQNGDTLDISRFGAFKLSLALERNTLNRKQYASSGNRFFIGLQYFNGLEYYQQGNILGGTPGFNKQLIQDVSRQWVTVKISQENYLFKKSNLNVGYLLEGVVSTKPLFKTYEESILSTPGFYPFQDSKTLILANFKAPSYGTAGLQTIVTVFKNFEWRSEGYVFIPIRQIEQNGLNSVAYSNVLGIKRIAATTGLVYQSFAGPISLSFNYYDDPQKRYGVMFHAGFLIFNKRALE